MESTTDPKDTAAVLATWPNGALRELIAVRRETGRAFDPVAEAARHELARRGEQA